MSRKISRTSGRQQGRSLNFECLEPRAMMSASKIINVQGPVGPSTGPVATPTGTVSPIIGTTRTTNTGPFTPAQIRSIYGFDKLSLNGAGTTIAIVDAYDDPTLIQDLHVFDQKFGLPDPNVTIAKEIDGDGNPPRADTGWSTETAIDVEWAHAIAPGANILLCQASDAGMDNLMDMVNFARNYSGVSVVSMSFGGREFERTWNPSSWFDENQTDYDSGTFTTPQGHRPVSFVASSGDDGSPFVKYPSTSPNVLAVGGTVITAFQNVTTIGNATVGSISATPFVASGPTNFASMSYDTETAWSKGGGGFSGVESRPAYQNGFNSNSMRSVPDVAYAATGFWIFNSADGGWETAWGTSCGAPQWAALIALVNQGRAQLGGDTLANTMSDIYRMPATDFHDITTGSTGVYSVHGRIRSNDRPRHADRQPTGQRSDPQRVPASAGESLAADRGRHRRQRHEAAEHGNRHDGDDEAHNDVQHGPCCGRRDSPSVSRLGHRARVSDAADQLTDALFGLDQRLS